MEDINFKVWKQFLKNAGLNKSDQLTYAQVFSDNQMDVRTLCDVMMMDTDASIPFLQKLGVKLGHQVRIFKQCKILHVGTTVENTPVEVIKLEEDDIDTQPDDVQATTATTPQIRDTTYSSISFSTQSPLRDYSPSQSDSAPPPSIPALTNPVPAEQTHFPSILAVTTPSFDSSNHALSSIIFAPSSSNSALSPRTHTLPVSSPVTPTLITSEQTLHPTILETSSPALSLSNPAPPKCTPSSISQITVPQDIAASPLISAVKRKTQTLFRYLPRITPSRYPRRKLHLLHIIDVQIPATLQQVTSLDSLRVTNAIIKDVSSEILTVAQKTATCTVCNKQLNTKSISRHYKVVHKLEQSTRHGRLLCREGRNFSVKQNIDSAWEPQIREVKSNGKRRLAQSLMENVQNPTFHVRRKQGEGGFGGQQKRMEGGIIVKNHLVPIELFLIEGEIEVGEQIPKDENDKCILKIRHKSNLDQLGLDVPRKIYMSNKHAIFLCLASTIHHAPDDGQEKRERSLTEFGNYLKKKKKAGVGSLLDRDKIQAGEMYVFPPCSLAMELLGRRRLPVEFCIEASKDNYLVLVVVWFKIAPTRALSPIVSATGLIGVRKSDRKRKKNAFFTEEEYDLQCI